MCVSFDHNRYLCFSTLRLFLYVRFLSSNLRQPFELLRLMPTLPCYNSSLGDSVGEMKKVFQHVVAIVLAFFLGVILHIIAKYTYVMFIMIACPVGCVTLGIISRLSLFALIPLGLFILWKTRRQNFLFSLLCQYLFILFVILFLLLATSEVKKQLYTHPNDPFLGIEG